MKIAEQAGLLHLFTRALKPLLIKIFPEIPKDDPAMGAIAMNFAANFLGLTNAATPFGLRAMSELEKINPLPGTATNAMCTFLTLHSCNLQLIPTTAIALLAAAGALHPTDIIVPILLSSLCAMVTAVIASKILERSPWFRARFPIMEKEGSLL
jgi:spore maturation protein A